MSRIDEIKEANARSRLFIGVLIAIDAALIGWIVQQLEAMRECAAAQQCASDDMSAWLVFAAAVGVAYISLLLMFYDWVLLRRIRELRNLE